MFHPARSSAKLWHAVSLASSSHSSSTNVHSLWRSPLLLTNKDSSPSTHLLNYQIGSHYYLHQQQRLSSASAAAAAATAASATASATTTATLQNHQPRLSLLSSSGAALDQQSLFLHNPLWFIDADESAANKINSTTTTTTTTTKQMPFSFANAVRAQGVMDNISAALSSNPDLDTMAKRNVVFDHLIDAFTPSVRPTSNNDDLNLIAQRVFAKLNDIEGLREWKKFATGVSPLSKPQRAPSPPSPVVQHTPAGLASPPMSPLTADVDASAAEQYHQLHHQQANRTRKPYLEHKSTELLSYSQRKVVNKAVQTFESLTAKHLTPLGDATAAFFNLLATTNQLPLAVSYFQQLDAIEQATAPRGKLNRHLYFLYNSIVGAACSAGEVHQAMGFYADMKARLNQVPDLRTVTKLFTLLSKAEDTEQTAAGDMPDPAHYASRRARSVSHSGHLELIPRDAALTVTSPTLAHMLTIFDDLQSHKITPYPLLFNLLLGKCTSTDNLSLATHIFGSMKQHRVPPTAVTYSTLISAHLAQHDLSAAEQLFDEMAAHPLAAHSAQFMNSIGPFNALLGYYVLQRKDWLNAHRVFHDVYESHGFLRFVRPTGYTFHLLILGAASLSSPASPPSPHNTHTSAIDRALGYLPLMRDTYNIQPSASHFAPILEALLDQRRFHEAKRLVLNTMHREYGYQLPTASSSSTSTPALVPPAVPESAEPATHYAADAFLDRLVREALASHTV
ncbi:hypothetical protein RI367_000541 [Sorochytrium milnesiophthora]